MTRLVTSTIVTAFDASTIGTKVTNVDAFMSIAQAAIENFDFAAQRVPGPGFIPYNDLTPYVSAGVGRRTTNPDDYVVRYYRGNVELFLRRKHAAEATGVAIIVYTREAYLADPDVQRDDMKRRHIEESNATHILVAVLGFAGPANSPLTPHRLVHNLAGGNKEALIWSADEIRAKAGQSKAYWEEWAVVAD